MYKGYLSFGGNELANAERTATYIRHAIPSFGLQENYAGCEYLAEALGHQPYSSPMSDTAPWFSPYNEASADFYGLIPLSIDGLEDSTRTAPITETTFDGGVIGMARNASRQVRVRALAAAADERAMDAGLSWLRNVLEGSGCSEGNCEGDDLCWLVDCPEPCDYSGSPVDITDVDLRLPTAAERIAAGRAAFSMARHTEVTSPNSVRYVQFATTDGSQPWVSLMLTDLVPGGVYRVDVGFANTSQGESGFAVSVPGASVPLNPLPMIERSFGTGTGPEWNKGGDRATFEFVATAAIHRLLIEGRLGDTSLTIYPGIRLLGVTVSRVQRRAIKMASMVSPRHAADQARAWNVRNAAITNVSSTVIYDNSSLLTYSNIATGAATIPARGAYLGRTMPGLTIGRRYRASLLLEMQGVGTLAATPPEVSLSPDNGATWTASASLPYERGLGSGSRMGWATVEFTATSRAQVIRVANGQALTLASGSGAVIGVSYIRVEEVLDGQPFEDPDPVDPLRRSLRKVTCISGPTMTREFDKASGTIREVEFIFQAGDPRAYGQEIEVPATLGPGSIYVPEQACSGGQPVRTNLWTNPRAISTSGWVNATPALASNFALTAVDSVNFAGIATRAFRLTCTAAPSDPFAQPRYEYTVSGITAEMMHTLSLYFYKPAIAGQDLSWGMGAYIYMSAVQGANFVQVNTTMDAQEVMPGIARQRVTGSWYTPAGSTGLKASVYFTPMRSTGWQVGDWIEFTAVQLEAGQVPTAFFDGNSQYGSWLGTSGLSASRWTRTSVALVTDPDCTPIPSPPRAPIIDVSCISDPANWLRYSADIPSFITQASQKALPVVALTAGAAAVRGVRVRFQANPMSLPWSMLNPCDYCGEFVASYIPPNATLTVDAASRQATLTVAGEDQTAMHLLYGSDGGPVVWPSLECGVPYTILVDLDSGTNALVDMDLAVIPAY